MVIKSPQLTNKKGTMETEKKIYYSDLADYVSVCYSCSSQNIKYLSSNVDGKESFCNDCNSEDIGAVFPEELI